MRFSPYFFRVEKADKDMINRKYHCTRKKTLPKIKIKDIDSYIADQIRQEVNDCSTRSVLSYSRSLATCLFKYDSEYDTVLHIYETFRSDCNFWGHCSMKHACNGKTPIIENELQFIDSQGQLKVIHYDIDQGLFLQNNSGDEEITLCNFIVDISDNSVLDKYLFKFTQKHKKWHATPQKDNEIVMMQASNDFVIRNIEAIKIMYALQVKTEFLSYSDIMDYIFDRFFELGDLPGFRSLKEIKELEGIKKLLIYIHNNWETEYELSKPIYEYYRKRERLSLSYDICYDILFNDIYDDSYGYEDPIIDIFIDAYKMV